MIADGRWIRNCGDRQLIDVGSDRAAGVLSELVESIQ